MLQGGTISGTIVIFLLSEDLVEDVLVFMDNVDSCCGNFYGSIALNEIIMHLNSGVVNIASRAITMAPLCLSNCWRVDVIQFLVPNNEVSWHNSHVANELGKFCLFHYIKCDCIQHQNAITGNLRIIKIGDIDRTQYFS